MHLSSYEHQYIKALRDIYENGFEDGTNERTGISTKRLPGIVIRVDVEKEFPILKSKFVAAKTALREIEWIWKQQSSKLSDLKARIWDEWGQECTANELVLIDHPVLDKNKYTIVDELINPLPEDIDTYERRSSHSYGDFIVLSRNGDKCTIQFINTGNIIQLLTKRMQTGHVMDYYARSCYDIGRYCDYKADDIMEYFGEYHSRWVDVWRGIMRRCKNHDGIYKDTYCSNNFTSCEYFLRWVMKNNRYKDKQYLSILQIDKDYYGYDFYSEDTCVLLTPSENASLVKSKWYVYHDVASKTVCYSKYQLAELLEKKNGEQYIQYTDFGEKNGISEKLNRVLDTLVSNGVITIIDPKEIKDGKLIRFSLKVDSNIGKAYGYQMDKPIKIYADIVHKTPESYREYANQAEFIINYLKEFPNGRWGVATLWNPAELSEMMLVPCCHTSTWNLDGGRLNCVLDQRSGDMPYGVPFNTTQYAELMIMLARDIGVKPGILTHVIADAHIYDNQMEGVDLQLRHYDVMTSVIEDDGEAFNRAALAVKTHKLNMSEDELVEKAKKALESVPNFVVATAETDFFAYNADDCYVEDYVHMGKIDFGDVAV